MPLVYSGMKANCTNLTNKLRATNRLTDHKRRQMGILASYSVFNCLKVLKNGNSNKWWSTNVYKASIRTGLSLTSWCSSTTCGSTLKGRTQQKPAEVHSQFYTLVMKNRWALQTVGKLILTRHIITWSEPTKLIKLIWWNLTWLKSSRMRTLLLRSDVKLGYSIS